MVAICVRRANLSRTDSDRSRRSAKVAVGCLCRTAGLLTVKRLLHEVSFASGDRGLQHEIQDLHKAIESLLFLKKRARDLQVVVRDEHRLESCRQAANSGDNATGAGLAVGELLERRLIESTVSACDLLPHWHELCHHSVAKMATLGRKQTLKASDHRCRSSADSHSSRSKCRCSCSRNATKSEDAISLSFEIRNASVICASKFRL